MLLSWLRRAWDIWSSSFVRGGSIGVGVVWRNKKATISGDRCCVCRAVRNRSACCVQSLLHAPLPCVCCTTLPSHLLLLLCMPLPLSFTLVTSLTSSLPLFFAQPVAVLCLLSVLPVVLLLKGLLVCLQPEQQGEQLCSVGVNSSILMSIKRALTFAIKQQNTPNTHLSRSSSCTPSISTYCAATCSWKVLSSPSLAAILASRVVSDCSICFC